MKMVTEKSWDEFRSSGMLWWTNRMLHMFGWAICFDYASFDKEKDAGVIKDVYPARCRFRGFDVNSETKGFKNVSKFLRKNIKQLEQEANE